MEELLLQILGAGGDDDFPPRPNHGQKISQGFARARACFDDQVTLLLERLRDGFGHPQLPAAEFIAGMALRKHSPGGEELIKRDISMAGWGSGMGAGLGADSHTLS